MNFFGNSPTRVESIRRERIGNRKKIPAVDAGAVQGLSEHRGLNQPNQQQVGLRKRAGHLSKPVHAPERCQPPEAEC